MSRSKGRRAIPGEDSELCRGDDPIAIYVSAVDEFGNRATSYAGTGRLISSEGTLSPVTINFTSGVGILSNVILYTSGSVTLSVVDILNVRLAGVSGSIAVFLIHRRIL